MNNDVNEALTGGKDWKSKHKRGITEEKLREIHEKYNVTTEDMASTIMVLYMTGLGKNPDTGNLLKAIAEVIDFEFSEGEGEQDGDNKLSGTTEKDSESAQPEAPDTAAGDRDGEAGGEVPAKAAKGGRARRPSTKPGTRR